MINADMKLYSFSTVGCVDAYGQASYNPEPQGQIKMAINILSQSVADNIKYINASYMGLTQDSAVNDSYVIHYGNEKLKVLYVNPKGRYKQVFMGDFQ